MYAHNGFEFKRERTMSAFELSKVCVATYDVRFKGMFFSKLLRANGAFEGALHSIGDSLFVYAAMLATNMLDHC